MSSSPTISDLLFAMLSSHRSSYQFHKIIREREFKRYRQESVQVSLSRLRKQGYFKRSDAGWSLTPSGILRAKEIILFSYIPSPFKEKALTNTIVSFDIPGPERHTRDWLRNQLKIFGYKMLQQSLWLGPGPLPDNFTKRLNNLGIEKNVKIFPIIKKSK